MNKQIDKARQERAKIKRLYRDLFDRVSALLFTHDPIGINFTSNTDEYDPEAGTIIPRLRQCQSAADTQQVVHEEFVHWFGLETAGAPEQYTEVSTEIWSAWQTYQDQMNRL